MSGLKTRTKLASLSDTPNSNKSEQVASSSLEISYPIDDYSGPLGVLWVHKLWLDTKIMLKIIVLFQTVQVLYFNPRCDLFMAHAIMSKR